MVGALVASVRAVLVARDVGRNDILATEAGLRQIDRIRDQLAGLSPTPIERLLAERAAVCGFEVSALDARVVRRWGEDGEGRVADGDDRLRDRAQRRHLAALKALAQVRRLAVPLLQLNLAHNQQINQAAASGAPLATGPGSSTDRGA